VDPDEAPADPSLARDALERLLLKEERISDLIAFLAALDPEPLLRALGLTARDPRIRREEMIPGTPGRGGRADLVVRDGAVPIALVEVKAAAGRHGDQLDRYDSWARAQDTGVRSFLVALVDEDCETPDGWRTDVTLPARPCPGRCGSASRSRSTSGATAERRGPRPTTSCCPSGPT